ncbi:MAG: aminopeptidase [Symbiobacteriia bacterium]
MDSTAIRKLADILVNYSTGVKQGDRVLIQGTELARPLIEEIYRLVVRNGGFPTAQVQFGSLQRVFYEEASDAQLDVINPILDYTFRNSDVLIQIQSSENTRAMSAVSPAKQRRFNKTHQPLHELVMGGKIRWNATLFPTQALAQDAGMSLDDYADFVFSATNIDWPATVAMMEKIKSVFDAGDQVRLVGKETDLTFSIKGHPGVVGDGKYNMPDGEVFYAPHEKSTNGHVFYEYPAIYSGREVSGIRLTFENGKVTQATADHGEDFLLQMLDTDQGARFLGEFGIGTNYGIQKFTRNILFDEKIGGTVHLAVGAAYTEGGIKANESAIHWDMVKEMREGGEIYLDGRLVQQNGKFLFL